MKTTAPTTNIVALPQTEALNHPDPEYLRPAGIFQKFSIPRGTLYDLMKAGKVQSIVKKVKGNTRGIRLVSVSSIRKWIESPDSTIVSVEVSQ
jgi:hypothetical protein